MKSLRIQCLIFLFVLGCGLAAAAPVFAHKFQELEKTPLPELRIPSIARKTLANGMRLLMLQDDELPVVRGYLYLRFGSLLDPPSQVGLGVLLGETLREGGAGNMSPAQFEETLDALGAELDLEVGKEYLLLSFKCLKEDLPKLLEMSVALLSQAHFDEAKFKLNQRQMLEALRRQNDDPAKIAMREFPKRVYGPDSPWARTPTAQSIEAIRREDLVAQYQKYFAPNRAILALSGDFDEKATVSSLEQLTANWPASKQKLPETPPLQKTWDPGTFVADKKADQATVVLGHFGDKRFNPDKYALLLLNEILGGEVLSSRLGKQIRSTLGLAYSIYSQFGLQTDLGLFFIVAQTKAENAQKLLAETQRILVELQEGSNLSEDELDFYKQSLLNSLYSQYEPKDNFARDEARFEFYGYPANYLQLFKSQIEKVSLADLRRVAKKYLKAEALKILVVGDRQRVGVLPGAQAIPLE